MGMLCNTRPIMTNIKYEISPTFVTTKPFLIKQIIEEKKKINNKLGCIQRNPARVVQVQFGPFIFEEAPLFWLHHSATVCLLLCCNGQSHLLAHEQSHLHINVMSHCGPLHDKSVKSHCRTNQQHPVAAPDWSECSLRCK